MQKRQWKCSGNFHRNNSAAETTAYTNFKPVKEVLKKHKYFIFKLIIDKQPE